MIRVLDLFCGGGGSSHGAERAGAEIVCGVDGWDVAIKTFRQNFPKAKAIKAWMREDSSPAELTGGIGQIDLILASPECTHHTCARGAKERNESSRATARFVLNFARALQPRWVILENVVHMKKWAGYRALIDELENDYFVREQPLDAAHFGVPQTRRRLFLLCDRERLPEAVLPTWSAAPRTARSIIEWDGTWKAGPLDNGRRAVATLARAQRGIDALGEGIDFLMVYYGSDASGGWQSLDRPLRTITTLDRFGLVRWRDGEPTLRMLQVPELRRAMGFGPDFLLEQGCRRENIKLLGNGVAPPVVEAIVRTLTSTTLSTQTRAPAIAAE
ncbi:MAG: DNA cytosine methyltransferase [Alphaproteobacteria bacterium]|jgi:DNA (cytosine-5)-methyltransferase 1|nr:DNA cytosine methyltransferase [Alphaproteobacteria bacterium]